MSRENNERILNNCNALGRYSDVDTPEAWMAFRVDRGKFYDPSGLQVAPPRAWRLSTLRDILDYYEENLMEAVSMRNTIN